MVQLNYTKRQTSASWTSEEIATTKHLHSISTAGTHWTTASEQQHRLDKVKEEKEENNNKVSVLKKVHVCILLLASAQNHSNKESWQMDNEPVGRTNRINGLWPAYSHIWCRKQNKKNIAASMRKDAAKQDNLHKHRLLLVNKLSKTIASLFLLISFFFYIPPEQRGESITGMSTDLQREGSCWLVGSVGSFDFLCFVHISTDNNQKGLGASYHAPTLAVVDVGSISRVVSSQNFLCSFIFEKDLSHPRDRTMHAISDSPFSISFRVYNKHFPLYLSKVAISSHPRFFYTPIVVDMTISSLPADHQERCQDVFKVICQGAAAYGCQVYRSGWRLHSFCRKWLGQVARLYPS